ncbi:GAF domain-containing protein (plasmid) [Paracoccus liaowanqingii]|uniref:histidine kinase n=1 Tax=Paracoccus liaowanqingii TaxID=2560053 RepID=A0A4Y5SUM2_9RHOB|nr:GAF domain-containing protein [Paracoccus liaowanqingii]QDA36495.1 GAF domain-containing protein [Paracoccus liaowanqingii]
MTVLNPNNTLRTAHYSEQARSSTLHSYQILDTPREAEFDDIAAMAAEVCQTPIAVVNFVDSERQFFKAEVGLGVRETPLDTSFCGHAILSEDMMIVPDARHDPRFEGNPLVTQEGGLRFYAGALLRTRDGYPIGTVCVLDTKPRSLDGSQIRTLKLLARQAMTQVELRAALADTQRIETRHRQVLNSAADYAIISKDLQGNVTGWNRGAENVFGWSEAEMLEKPVAITFNPADQSAGVPELEMAAARESGRAADERWHVKKDGSRFFASAEMMPLRDDAGNHVGYVNILRDQTQARRQAQQLALLSQAASALLNTDDPAATLRPILAGGADAVGFDMCFLYDVAADGQHLELRHSVGVNEEISMALRRVSFDVPLCGIVAERAEPLVLENLHLSCEPRYEIARTSGVQAYAGFPICFKDKVTGVVSFVSSEVPAFDDDALSFFQTIARFMSVSRERAEDARVLRDAERRLRLAQEAGRIGTFEMNLDTGIIVASPQFCRTFGLAEAPEVSTVELADLILNQAGRLQLENADYWQSGAHLDVDYRICRADDQAVRWVSRRAEHILDEKGHVRGMFGTVQDITEQKNSALYQNALLKLGEELRQVSTLKEMTHLTCRLLLETLDVSRAGYATRKRKAAQFTIIGECLSGDVPPMEGHYQVADFFRTAALLETGHPLIMCNAEEEVALADDLQSYQNIQVAAHISVPQFEKGDLVGALFVHQVDARRWEQGEIDFMRRVSDRLLAALSTARAEEEQAVLNQELSHRLKNSLSMVQAIATQTLRAALTPEALYDFTNRLHALSQAHNVLLHRNWEAGEIKDVIESTLAALVQIEHLQISGPPVELGPKTTLTLSMLLHELATNAIKYGAFSNEAGRVEIRWQLEKDVDDDHNLVIQWREVGGPKITKPQKKGFGSRLLQVGLVGTGGVDLNYDPLGLIVTLKAPLVDATRS